MTVADPRPAKRIKDINLVRNFSVRSSSCAVCGEGRAAGLQAHHVLYKGGRRGDDVVSNLVALCLHCHEAVHNGDRYVKHQLGQHIVFMREDILAYLYEKLGTEAGGDYLVREFGA